MPAAGALQQRCPHRPRFVVPASRTTKTLRPAELTQILSTGLLGGETRLELGQIPRIIFHFPDPTSCGHLSQVNTHLRLKIAVGAVKRLGYTLSQSLLITRRLENRMQRNRMQELCFQFAVVLALLCLGSTAAYGQTAFGSVNGTVADETQAVIPGATVSLTNVGTGAEITIETNAGGYYVFPNVAPGNYSTSVTAEGFSTAIQPQFAVNVNQTLTHNFSLAVGSVTETVEVTAEAALLQQSTSELGTAITEEARQPIGGTREIPPGSRIEPFSSRVPTQSGSAALPPGALGRRYRGTPGSSAPRPGRRANHPRTLCCARSSGRREESRGGKPIT